MYQDGEDATPPLPSPKKNKPTAKPVYKDDSSDDDLVDDGQLEGEGSDYEASKPKKSPAKKSPKKTPAKKTVAKKSPKKKAAVTPSRASGRAVQSIKYADDNNDDEEEEEDEEESEDEAPLRGRGKVAAKAKAPFKKAKMAAHPPVSEMIPIAIRKLNENPKLVLFLLIVNDLFIILLKFILQSDIISFYYVGGSVKCHPKCPTLFKILIHDSQQFSFNKHRLAI